MDPARSAMEEVQLTEGHILNILLLGPSGVGKSTFINAFANYLKFKTVEEALEHDLLSLIYSEFTMTDTKDGRIVQTKISVGVPDGNEAAKSIGSSCTQKCKAYRFRINETQSIRLIDTPGIGDTGGPEQDRENMKDTLSYLSQYEVLHAVCILLKPNEERLTDSLWYCIVQLLEKLHKDASRNILFCFTNTRSTQYRVGRTYGLIESMLIPKSREDNILLDIQLANVNTMYCFDSEAYNFCAAKKNGVQYDDLDNLCFKRSWERSTKEAHRLIKHIGSLDPHEIKNTLSLNRVRSLLETLEGPMEKIKAAMQTNMAASKEAQSEIEQSHDTYLDNSKLLYVKKTTPETVGLPQPRLVCVHPECRAAHKVCHDKCDQYETAVGIAENVESKVGDALQKVAASVSVGPFNFDLSSFFSRTSTRVVRSMVGEDEDSVFCEKLSLRSGVCKVCSHPRKNHNREKSELRIVTNTVKDPVIQKILDETTDKAEQKKKMLKVYKDKEATIKTEIDVVSKAAALFAGFMEQNSIITYHSATPTYVRNLIIQRELSGDRSTAEETKQLETSLKTYEDSARHFRKSNQVVDLKKLITEDEIKTEIQNLCQLKEYGPVLEKWMKDVDSAFAFEVAMARAEVVCNIQPSGQN